MIATCQPTATGWNAGLPPAERSGSLRRIDDIVSELLTGYAELLPGNAPATEIGAPQAQGDSIPPIHAAQIQIAAHAHPAEMMLAGEC